MQAPLPPRKRIKTSKQYRKEQEELTKKMEQELLQQEQNKKFMPKRRPNSQQARNNSQNKNGQFYNLNPNQKESTNTLMQNSSSSIKKSDNSRPLDAKMIGKEQQQQEQIQDISDISMDKSQTLKKGFVPKDQNFEKTLPASDMQKQIDQMKNNLFARQNQNQQAISFPTEDEIDSKSAKSPINIVNSNNQDLSDQKQEKMSLSNTQRATELDLQQQQLESGPSFIHGISPVPQTRNNMNFSQLSAVRKASTLSIQTGFSQKENQKETLLQIKQRQIEERELRKLQEQEEKKKRREEALEKKSQKARDYNATKIQSLGRMYLAKIERQKRKRKWELLKRENQTENKIREYEQMCLDQYFTERNDVFISEKFSKTFSVPKGPNTLHSIDLKKNVFYPTLFKALAEQGNLDILLEEKESEAQFNQEQRYKLQRPKTMETRGGFVHHVYEKPNEKVMKKPISQNYMKQLTKDQTSVIDLFVKQNIDSTNTIKKAGQNARMGDFATLPTEVPLRKLNKTEAEINRKINSLKQQLDNEHRQEHNIQESSANKFEESYYSDFEKESEYTVSQSESNQKLKNKGLNPNKSTLSLNKSRISNQESVISEEQYLQESFENEESISSQIQESIGGNQSASYRQDSSKINESIKVEEQYSVEESVREDSVIREDSGLIKEDSAIREDSAIQEDSVIQEDSIIREDSAIQEDSMIREDIGGSYSKRSKSSGIIEEKIGLSQSQDSEGYYDEKFESISDEVSQSQIRYASSKSDEAKRPKKKSVSFNQSQDKGFGFNSNQQNQQQQYNYQQNQQQQYQQQQQATSPSSKYPNFNKTAPSPQQFQQFQPPVGTVNMAQDDQFQLFMQFQQFQQFLQQNPNQQPQQQQFQGFSTQQFQKPQQQQQPEKQYQNVPLPEKMNEKVQKIYEKYKPLQILDQQENTNLTKEFMEIEKIRAETQKQLQESKEISKKWEAQRLQEQRSQTQQKTDMLYTKFQCEFNNMLMVRTFGDKLKVLSNYAFYKEMNDLRSGKESENNNKKQSSESLGYKVYQDPLSQQKKLNDLPEEKSESFVVLADMIKTLENKQEVIATVLTRLMDNLTEIKESSAVFGELKEKREDIETKIQLISQAQQKIMQQELNKKLEKRDEQFQNMFEKILQNQEKSKKSDGIKSKFKDLVNKNRETDYDDRTWKRKTDDEEYDDYLERKYDYKFNEQLRKIKASYGFNAAYWDELDRKMSQKEKEQFMKEYGKRRKYKNDSSSDVSAGKDNSNISWQSDNLFDNIPPEEKKKMNKENTEQIVDYLTNILLDDIKSDLFPLRTNVSKLERKKSDEVIHKQDGIKWVSPARQKSLSKESIDSMKSPRSIQHESSQEFSEEKVEQSNNLYNKESEKPKSSQQASKVQNFDSVKEKNWDISSPTKKDKENPLTSLPASNSFAQKSEPKKNQENSISQSSDQSDSLYGQELKDYKQEIVSNPKTIKHTQEVLDVYTLVLKRKNREKILNKIMDCIESNERKAFPEFTGAALSKVKLIDNKEIEDLKNEQLIVNNLEERFIGITVQNIQEIEAKKINDKEEIMDILLQRFDQIVQQAGDQVQKNVEKQIAVDCYDDVELNKNSDFDKIYSFCNKNLVPKEKDQADIGEEFIKYELEKATQEYRGQIGDKIIEQIFKDTVKDYEDVFKKRKELVKSQQH